jgi:hypothetical protein
VLEGIQRSCRSSMRGELHENGEASAYENGEIY